jgi:uncharacterized membrane protein YuzA (DUF378 family)
MVIFRVFANNSFENKTRKEEEVMDRLSLILVIIGAINWGLIALFQFDLVASLFGGQDAVLSRIVYGLVGLAGLYCITLLFREREKSIS